MKLILGFANTQPKYKLVFSETFLNGIILTIDAYDYFLRKCDAFEFDTHTSADIDSEMLDLTDIPIYDLKKIKSVFNQ